jgi:hypothetical protein
MVMIEHNFRTLDVSNGPNWMKQLNEPISLSHDDEYPPFLGGI